MWRMKIFWTILSGAISLMVVSCTPFQQQTISDLLPPPENETRDSLKKPLEESESATNEVNETQEPQTTAEAPKKAEKAENAEKEEIVTPTPEQQAAAEKLLAESAEKNSASPSTPQAEALPQTFGNSDVQDMPAPLPSLPGRTALRMGQYAPPEEAASVGEAQSFRPNSAEQHGFRSPMLPASLPMDIHGKLTGEDKN